MMQASITVVLVGVLLACSIGAIFLPGFIALMVNGLTDLLSEGSGILEILIGTKFTLILSCFLTTILLIYLARFFISWLGEDSGSSANK